MRLFKPSAKTVVKMASKSDVRGLMRLLKDRDASSLKGDIIDALGALKAKEAVEQLIDIIRNSRDQDTQTSVTAALLKIGDVKAVEAVEDALGNNATLPFLRMVRETGESMMIDVLLLTLEKRREDTHYIGRVCDIITPMREKRFVPALLRIVAAANEFNLDFAIKALKAIEDALSEADASLKADIRSAIEKDRQRKEKAAQEKQSIVRKVTAMTEDEMLQYLMALGVSYAANDAGYREKEVVAKMIGQRLHEEGGIRRMREIFAKLGAYPGSRTLEILWGGVGDWQG